MSISLLCLLKKGSHQFRMVAEGMLNAATVIGCILNHSIKPQQLVSVMSKAKP